MNRRSFLGTFLLVPAAWLLGWSRFASAGDEDIAKKMAKPTDPLPSALKYTEDAKKAAAGLRRDATSTCGDCIQYTKKGTYKGKEYGTCNLFQGSYVSAGGWCMSWSKKG